MGSVNPTTKEIEWKETTVMEVKAKMPESKEAETTKQSWDINYKKRIVEEFGTSKSKRKINQMFSNIIN